MQELVAELARLVLEQVPPQVPVRARRLALVVQARLAQDEQELAAALEQSCQ